MHSEIKLYYHEGVGAGVGDHDCCPDTSDIDVTHLQSDSSSRRWPTLRLLIKYLFHVCFAFQKLKKKHIFFIFEKGVSTLCVCECECGRI